MPSVVKFSFIPGLGPEPLKMGMTQEEVINVIGKGRCFLRDRSVKLECMYPDMTVAFGVIHSNEINAEDLHLGLCWVSFMRSAGVEVTFQGVSMFDNVAQVISSLLKANGTMEARYDALVFDDLGVALRGLSDEDLALVFFPPGLYKTYG